MKGARVCLLYQGFYYIEVYFFESKVHLVRNEKIKGFFKCMLRDPGTDVI